MWEWEQLCDVAVTVDANVFRCLFRLKFSIEWHAWIEVSNYTFTRLQMPGQTGLHRHKNPFLFGAQRVHNNLLWLNGCRRRHRRPFVSLCSHCNYLIFAIHGIRVPIEMYITCWPPPDSMARLSRFYRDLKQENAKWVCVCSEWMRFGHRFASKWRHSLSAWSERAIRRWKIDAEEKPLISKNVRYPSCGYTISSTINGSAMRRKLSWGAGQSVLRCGDFYRAHYSFPFPRFFCPECHSIHACWPLSRLRLHCVCRHR